MKLLCVATAALNQTPLDWDGNEARIRQVIRAARARGVAVLCLPELCIPGYGCEDAFHSAANQAMAWRVLESLMGECEGMVVTLGLPLWYESALFNVAALVIDGDLVGLVPKQHLAGDGLHYEQRWFKAWPSGVLRSIKCHDQEIPLGDLMIEVDGIRLGLEICEDAWVADRPGLGLAERGVDLIMNPSASHFAFGKQERRLKLVEEASRALGVTYVYSNLQGNEAGRAIYDGSVMVATAGRMVAEGPRFSFQPWLLTDCVVDINQTRLQRERSVGRELHLEDDPGLITHRMKFPECAWEPEHHERAAWEESSDLKEEEFTRAIALALYDYARKSRSHGFVVSLSGGADSTAVVVLIYCMLHQAMQELSMSQIVEAFGISPQAKGLDTPEALMKYILTTVYQSTANSSMTTTKAAERVAAGVGARHLCFDVEDLVTAYVDMVQQAMDRPLTWEEDDIALQNIQARVRAPVVWMLANLEGKLLLSTSNRSEAAVGYATMDGDTCGGISPIAGIDKAFLLSWLSWMEHKAVMGMKPLTFLHVVNALKPSAELRPEDRKQTDEDDLMPYVILDAIEHEAIALKRSPSEVLAVLTAQYPEYESALLAWVNRFFELWSRNQWKRERYAPSFHLDDLNLDPKTWCRFPILSGAFQRELRELNQQDFK